MSVSGNFEVLARIPEHGLLDFRRAYVFQTSALAADATNYWTIRVIQHDPDGREITLAVFDGSKTGLVADKPTRIPAQGNVNKPLLRELPILIKGTKTGSPSDLGDISVQVVLALR